MRLIDADDISDLLSNLLKELKSKTHNTNPIAFMRGNQSFVSMMDDESTKGFGDWMFNNGFNTALTVAECYVMELIEKLEEEKK